MNRIMFPDIPGRGDSRNYDGDDFEYDVARFVPGYPKHPKYLTVATEKVGPAVGKVWDTHRGTNPHQHKETFESKPHDSRK